MDGVRLNVGGTINAAIGSVINFGAVAGKGCGRSIREDCLVVGAYGDFGPGLAAVQGPVEMLEIIVELRGLWRRRKIPLDEIRSVDAVSYDPMDFGGYGMRSTRAGTAYIARGNRAVRLVLVNGQRILIGSQNAAELTGKIVRLRRRVKA